MSRQPTILSKLFLPILIVAAGAGVFWYYARSRPTPRTKTPEPIVALVEVREAQTSDYPVRVHAMGTVEPAREVWVQPQVGGSVTAVNPALMPGSLLHQGEWIFRIDPRDYENAVEQARAAVVRAEYEIKVEEGRSTVARREWELFDKEIPASAEGKALALREPQLENAFAQLAAAKSQLAQTKLNLSRTEPVAPFNCLVIEESVDPGQQVSPQVRAARIVGTDTYRVRVSVPVNELKWIRFQGPDGKPGAEAVVEHRADASQPIRRNGHVVRLSGDLDGTGRLSKVLVEVRDPLGLALPEGEPRPTPLLLGAYVHVAIEGQVLRDVFVLPRPALREGREVWLMNKENRLEIRPVEIVWQDRESVCISGGLKRGESVVVNALSTPIEGMLLTVAGEEPATSAQPETDASAEADAEAGGDSGGEGDS